MTPVFADGFQLTARTFDSDYFVQICYGDKVLVTVGEPTGPGNGAQFCIWEGTGLGEDDEELSPYSHVTRQALETTEQAYKRAALRGYELAVRLWNQVA